MSKAYQLIIYYQENIKELHYGGLHTYEASILKGTATLMTSMFYMKELYEPWILIPVSSKSVEKYGSCGRLTISKWPLMEVAIL